MIIEIRPTEHRVQGIIRFNFDWILSIGNGTIQLMFGNSGNTRMFVFSMELSSLDPSTWSP